MIDLYYAKTPNGQKLRIFMEETALPHRAHLVRLGKGEQHRPEFLAISQNNKIPALVDHAPIDGGAPVTLFESGALLVYLAEKTGRFMPADLRGRMEVLKWLFWQVGGLGPMGGQAGHFNRHAPEPVPYAIDRYTREVARLFRVMDRRLGETEYLAGGDYSIADIASYPWVVPYDGFGQRLDDFPNLARWFRNIAARPAVVRVYVGVTSPYAKEEQPLSAEERRALFGAGTESKS